MIDIHLQPEYIGSIAGLAITNTFVTSVLVTVILAMSAIIVPRIRDGKNALMNIQRVIVYELLKMTDMVTRDRALSKRILPVIATFFLFIVTANLLALLPGFLGSFFVQTDGGAFPVLRSPNSDLTTTLSLAIVSVLSIQFFSIRTLGALRYIGRFFSFRSPMKCVLGFFELLSEAVKVLSFSFRLFGNIFAGEVLLLVVAFLVPYLIPVPFMILEFFVGVLQAFIFAILTLTFIKTSTLRHVRAES